jgi:hypothetical protein
MWHIATKKHEAFRQAIFRALTFLAGKCLTCSEIRCLFYKIKTVAVKDHDRASLALLKAIAKRLAASDKPRIELSSNFNDQLRKVRPRSLSETKIVGDQQQTN